MKSKAIINKHLVDAKRPYVIYEGKQLFTDKGWFPHKAVYFDTLRDMQDFETALLEDYEDYMTDRISREPGKIFDRKAVIQEFLPT